MSYYYQIKSSPDQKFTRSIVHQIKTSPDLEFTRSKVTRSKVTTKSKLSNQNLRSLAN